MPPTYPELWRTSRWQAWSCTLCRSAAVNTSGCSSPGWQRRTHERSTAAVYKLENCGSEEYDTLLSPMCGFAQALSVVYRQRPTATVKAGDRCVNRCLHVCRHLCTVPAQILARHPSTAMASPADEYAMRRADAESMFPRATALHTGFATDHMQPTHPSSLQQSLALPNYQEMYASWQEAQPGPRVRGSKDGLCRALLDVV